MYHGNAGGSAPLDIISFTLKDSESSEIVFEDDFAISFEPVVQEPASMKPSILEVFIDDEVLEPVEDAGSLVYEIDANLAWFENGFPTLDFSLDFIDGMQNDTLKLTIMDDLGDGDPRIVDPGERFIELEVQIQREGDGETFETWTLPSTWRSQVQLN